MAVPVSAEPEALSKAEPRAGNQATAAAVGEKRSIRSSLASLAPRSAGVIERIAAAAPIALTRGVARIRIALSPAHLGELLIDLSMGGALLHASVRTENEAARDLILTQLDQLRRSLEQQGIRVGEFQVSVDPSFRRGREGPGESAAGGLEEARVPETRYGPRSIRTHVLDVVA